MSTTTVPATVSTTVPATVPNTVSTTSTSASSTSTSIPSLVNTTSPQIPSSSTGSIQVNIPSTYQSDNLDDADPSEHGFATYTTGSGPSSSSNDTNTKPISHFFVDQSTEQYVAEMNADVINGFLAKVYGILSVQFLITVGVACLFMFNTRIRHFCAIDHPIISIIIPIVLMIVFMVCLTFRMHDFPSNILLLLGFTLAMSTIVGSICAVTYTRGGGGNVLIAFEVALGVFVVLSILSACNCCSMSFVVLGFCVVGIAFAFWSVICIALPWSYWRILPLFSAILFGFYILFDTYSVLYSFGPDDYIVCCIQLYLDTVMVFVYLLSFLNSDKNK